MSSASRHDEFGFWFGSDDALAAKEAVVGPRRRDMSEDPNAGCVMARSPPKERTTPQRGGCCLGTDVLVIASAPGRGCRDTSLTSGDGNHQTAAGCVGHQPTLESGRSTTMGLAGAARIALPRGQFQGAWRRWTVRRLSGSETVLLDLDGTVLVRSGKGDRPSQVLRPSRTRSSTASSTCPDCSEPDAPRPVRSRGVDGGTRHRGVLRGPASMPTRTPGSGGAWQRWATTMARR